LAFVFPDPASSTNLAFWFDTGTETQPNLATQGIIVGTYVQVTISPTATAAAIATATATAFGAYSAVWGLSTTGAVNTVTSVVAGWQQPPYDVNTTAQINVTLTGNP